MFFVMFEKNNVIIDADDFSSVCKSDSTRDLSMWEITLKNNSKVYVDPLYYTLDDILFALNYLSNNKLITYIKVPINGKLGLTEHWRKTMSEQLDAKDGKFFLSFYENFLADDSKVDREGFRKIYEMISDGEDVDNIKEEVCRVIVNNKDAILNIDELFSPVVKSAQDYLETLNDKQVDTESK